MLTAEVFLVKCTSDDSRETQTRAVGSLFNACGFDSVLPDKGIVAVKTHFGEGSCRGYIKPHIIAEGVRILKGIKLEPFVTDTNTLYRGNRHNSVAHLHQAAAHGFTFDTMGCPVMIADGLRGNNDEEIEVNCNHMARVPIAGDIVRSDGLMVFSHLTGHLAVGFGAAIKNLAMGCTPRRGKLMQHSSLKPWIREEDCISCGTCVEWCPEDAISMNGTAHIDQTACIGCGECLTVCPSMAVNFSWKQESRILQEKMAEFALGVKKALRGRMVFFNVVLHVTRDCDCIDRAQHSLAPDVGILASSDPVALDRASIDVFREATGRSLHELSYPLLTGFEQLEYAEKIGLGMNKYVLKMVHNV